MRQERLRIGVGVCLILLSWGALQAEAPPEVTIIRDLPYRTDHATLNTEGQARCRLDVAIPKGQKNFPTVIWFHGGGLVAGDKHFPEPLLKEGIGVVTAGYRLTPGVPVTTCLDDAAAASAWVHREIGKYGGSSEKIVISGHSAGGYLAMMIGLDPQWLAKYQMEPSQFAGLAPFSGQTVTHVAARAELKVPRMQPLINELAPLYHLRKDAPPMLLLTGDRERELMARYEENAYLWRMLKTVGHPDVTLIEFPGTDHGSMVTPGYAPLMEFVRRVTN